MSKNNKGKIPPIRYFVQGMHCASCEMIIEKKIGKEKGVSSVEVDLNKGQVLINTKSHTHISESYLNYLFKDDGYTFSVKPLSKNNKLELDQSECEVTCTTEESTEEPNYMPYAIAIILVMGFYLLQKSGFTSLISVNSQSSLPVFFLFGLLAGLSSCAALVGGIILSLSKQWLSQYGQRDSFLRKSEPHILFNVGRVVGYGLLGGLLGYVGTFFKLSSGFSATMVLAVSMLMVLMGLQMLGVKALAKFQLRFPKALTRKFSNEENFQGRFGPLLMGALTFFLPCGFTITAQALALSSGSTLQGALIMALFALGTVPGLLAIGLSSVKLFSNPQISKQFSIVAGVLVLFFAAFNINSQLSVLGVSNLGDVLGAVTSTQATGKGTTAGLVPVEGGKQVVRMNASSSGYSPNRFKVKVGQVVRLEITDTGTSGCTNAVISKLWDGQISLTPGQVSTKEFTPTKAGVYKFSCWMGMVTGTIEVVDSAGKAGPANAQPIGTGAKGCGCGGGGSCGGSK